MPRARDITRGDYWGIPKEFDNGNKGFLQFLSTLKREKEYFIV